MARKQHNVFFSLVKWEFQEYLSPPVLEFVIISAMASVLIYGMQTSLFSHQYPMLYFGPRNMFAFLTLAVSVVFSRSFSGSFTRGEVKMLLSYPIERRQLMFSKIVVLFVTVFAVYSVVFSLNIYLLSLDIFEPLFYVSLLALLIQLMLTSTIAITISVLLRNEVVSVLASILLLFGIDSVSADIGGSLSLLSSNKRFGYLFGYVGQLTHGSNPIGSEVIAADTVTLAILIPVGISISLLVLLYWYFTRFMEVD